MWPSGRSRAKEPPVARRSLTVVPDADDEFLEAARWYERRRAGLGGEFIDAVDGRIDRIRDAPDGYESLGDGVRRAPVGRFPYSIVFRASASRVVVLAIPHDSQDDRVWKRRVGLR